MDLRWYLFSFKGRIRRALYWRFFLVFFVVGLVIGGSLIAQSMIHTAQAQAFCRQAGPGAAYAADCKELAVLNTKYEFKFKKSRQLPPSITDFCNSEKAAGKFNGNCDLANQFRTDFSNKYPAQKQTWQKSPLGVVVLIIFIAFIILLIWAGSAIQAKRLHDRNLSGWWQLLAVPVSIVGAIFFFSLGGSNIFTKVLNIVSYIISIGLFINYGFLKGTPGPNKYGQNPLQINTIEGNAI